MVKSARGGDKDSDSRVPPWTCHSEIANNRRDLQFLGSSGLPIPIPSVTSWAQISCVCARFDALTNSFAITSFKKKIIVKLVFFLATLFHVVPESGNNRRLSHAAATKPRAG